MTTSAQAPLVCDNASVIIDKDVLFHLDGMIAAQTEYMWTAALAVGATAALFAAFFIRKTRRSRFENVSIAIFYISITLSLISFLPGYFVNNAMILSAQNFLVTNTWCNREVIELSNLSQSLLVCLGFIAFICAILVSAKTAATAAKSLGGNV